MKLVTMTTKQRDIMFAYMGKMSYFNAAEGVQWSMESEKRSDLKIAARIDILDWISKGLDKKELEEFVDTNGGLCKFNDFISSKMIDDVINKGEIEL